MTAVLSQLAWLLIVVAVVVAVALAPDWVRKYYQQPDDEPTLLDAPHAAEQARRVLHAAETECAVAVLDEYAVRYPMPQRPGPAPAAPSEPWQLGRKDDAGLVELGDFEINPLGGENS